METECPEGQTREVGRPEVGSRDGVHVSTAGAAALAEAAEEPATSGVRASVVALKPGNAGGAKGRRKVDVSCRAPRKPGAIFGLRRCRPRIQSEGEVQVWDRTEDSVQFAC